MNLIGIQSYQVDDVWPDIEHLILKPLERTGSIKDYSLDDLKQMIKSREMQLWIAADQKPVAAFLTRILVFPKRKVFSQFLAGAEDHTMDLWLDLRKTFIDYAKANDCQAIRTGGRKGWARKLNVTGQEMTLFTEELS